MFGHKLVELFGKDWRYELGGGAFNKGWALRFQKPCAIPRAFSLFLQILDQDASSKLFLLSYLCSALIDSNPLKP